MALSRKQKKWLRTHRGLVNFINFILILLIIALIYFVVALFVKDLRPSNIISRLQGVDSEESTDNQNTLDLENENVNNTVGQTQGTYESNLIVLDDGEELSEVWQAALAYEVPQGAQKPYEIKVNRAANTVTVYGIDSNGFYSTPIKAMTCSTGKTVGDTPLGNGSITDKYEFHLMVDGTYGQYAVRYMDGGILFHSVPYYSNQKDMLETDQFNLLGSVASLGCVRLCVADVLWIYENCPEGTPVVVYDDESNPGPLGKPDTIKIPENSQFAGWDPTDPDEANPWHAYSAEITIPETTQIAIGDVSFDPMNGVSAVDTCGNDITDKVKMSGSYDLGIPGTYTIEYSVEDAIGSTDSKTRTIVVAE
jgi:lipoprotein-anchoring transpeptidase ErfK/SrfK